MKRFKYLFIAAPVVILFSILFRGNATGFQDAMLIMIFLSVMEIKYCQEGGER